MKIFLTFIVFLFFLQSCNDRVTSVKESNEKYSNCIGDILFNPKIDSPSFKLCDSINVIHRRNALTYLGGRNAFKDEIFKSFKFKPQYQSFTGYITIRFILNCKKETGRYRVHTLGLDFSLQACPENLKQHLLSLVKELKGWEQVSLEDKNADCSKYLNFKIEDGKIKEILQ